MSTTHPTVTSARLGSNTKVRRCNWIVSVSALRPGEPASWSGGLNGWAQPPAPKPTKQSSSAAMDECADWKCGVIAVNIARWLPTVPDHRPLPETSAGSPSDAPAIRRIETEMLGGGSCPSGGSPDMVERILGLLRQLREMGKLVVFIEHDIASVRQVADSVVVMDEGKIIAQGKPAEVLERPEIMEAYVG